MTARKKYPKEFKLDAISLVLEQADGQAFRGNGKQTPAQEEIKGLKAQVKLLEMEKPIKKGDVRNAASLLCLRNEIRYSFITEHKKT